MIVVGISAFYHDAACCVVRDGRVVAAALEERFTGIKHDPSLPVEAYKSCLDSAGLTIADIDLIAYYELPEEKLSRKIHMGALDPEHLDAARLDRLDPDRPRREISARFGFEGPIRMYPHHRSHAASSYYFSGFDHAAIMTADGVGEWATTTYGEATGTSLELFEQVDYPHSIGLLYSAVTHYLGFEVNDGEYKVMGLAPYGTPRFRDAFDELLTNGPEGRFEIDLGRIDVTGRSTTAGDDALAALFGVPRRRPESGLDPIYADVAASLQVAVEELLLSKARYLHERTQAPALCLAGGVALNCVANGRLRREGPFSDLFVPPAPSDAGGAIGAAMLAHLDEGGRLGELGPVTHPFLGPSFSDDETAGLLDSIGLPYRRFGTGADAADHVAGLLAGGAVVGWFQGRMEFGPRALGNRSVLADPRDPAMRDRINRLVKKREEFRPFAPVVLERLAHLHFDLKTSTPFMTETCQVTSPIDLPAVTHVDGSARVQTVGPSNNPRLVALLEAFLELTGCPVLLNTSFNLRGEAIVCTPADAIATFARSGIDVLVIGTLMIDRADLPTEYCEEVADFYEMVARARRVTVSHDAYTLV
jgi:carbamoyltransferase